ncbi:MAG: lytic transglycosylase domain-containing protein [Desulfohalobiaceae bacterium]|nr:lytic transglycosylase domain-containing protein [Desulfohalobiaceae bacterium]MCF8086056.1 lytic transglycosylase domain-containing protein [Desulfohalobiaceae bacterium]
MACLALAALVLSVFALGQAVQAEGLFYYKDENGVMHVTDTPDSKKYKPFCVFGDKRYSRKELEWLVRKYGARYGVDPNLGVAVLKAESDFQRGAESSSGAQGLMQIMPVTQKDLGVKDPFDPEDNIAAGVRYLGWLLEKYDRVRLAVAAYNAGPGIVDQYGGIPPYQETKEYVERVISFYSRFQNQE